MKTMTTLAFGLALLAGTALADHHPMQHGKKGMHMMPDEKCDMMLSKDGKPMHKMSMEECMKMPCCKGMKMGGMDHGMNMNAKGDQGPSSLALNQANVDMHKGMDIVYTGDADIDFLRGMIAHHQGAVDMAQVQLRYGRDAQVKRMAQDIIRGQKLEIRWMQNWLKQLEAKGPRKADATAPERHWDDSAWTGKTWLNER